MSKTEQLKEIAQMATTTSAMASNSKTPAPDKVTVSEAALLNGLAHVKRLEIETQRILREKPNAHDILGPIIQEIQTLKQAMPKASTTPPPTEREVSPPISFRFSASNWVGLILLALISIFIVIAWQSSQMRKLDDHFYYGLDQVYKEVIKNERH